MATKRIILLIAITVLLIASTTVPALALLSNGQSAPNFQFTDLSGKVHTLSDYRGKVVVIDFFGYACTACINDAKDNLVPMYNTYYKNDAKVQFLGVEVNGASDGNIQQFVTKTGVPWPVGSGASSIGSAYQIAETPTLYVINPAGNVALTMLSPTNVQTLKSTIDSLEVSSAPVVPAPTVCSRDGTSLDLFARGADGALWWKHWDGTKWSTSKSLGGYLTSAPSATSPTSSINKEIDVFMTGTNGVLYELTTTDAGGHWAWSKLSGQLLAGTSPAAYNWGSGLTGVFVTGTNHNLYQKTNRGLQLWQSLGGYLTSGPGATGYAVSAGTQPNGEIGVVAAGTNSALYYRHFSATSGWDMWTAISGQLLAGTSPAAYNWGSARIGWFVTGTDTHLYQTWSGSTTGWQNLGGVLTSGPGATAPASNKIDVFVRGGGNGIWQETYNGGWSGWTSVGAM